MNFKRVLRLCGMAALSMLAVLGYVGIILPEDGTVCGSYAHLAFPRFMLAGVFFLLLWELGLQNLLHGITAPKGRALVFCMPALCIALNNFQFMPLLTQDATLVITRETLGMLLIYALAVGLYEEILFRGCLFSLILQHLGKRRGAPLLAILGTSAVFALLHLVNLPTWGVAAVLRQIGYSFLIGAMCTVILLRTNNLWICVILHGIYDFTGGLMGNFAVGNIWTIPEIALTACVSMGVACFYLIWGFWSGAFLTAPQASET